MELKKLYKIAENENIPIYDFKMKNKAIIAQVENNYYIGLNYSKIETDTEEKELLAEELGHYYCNALYAYTDDILIQKKQEYRAKKWSFKILAPAKRIKKLYEQGCQYSYEMAEELGVSENLLNTAVSYYKENNYI